MSIGVERDISHAHDTPGRLGKAVAHAYHTAAPVAASLKKVSGALAETRAWETVREPFKQFAELRYYGHKTVPYTDYTIDLYQSSGSMLHRRPEVDAVKQYLLADDLLTADSAAETWIGGDLTVNEINEAYETVITQYLDEDTIHIGAELPVTGKMGVSLVPLSFYDVEHGERYDIGASHDDKPYETGFDDAFHIDIPAFLGQDGELLEGFMTEELHVEVPENVVNLDLRCRHEKQHIWRLIQYLGLGEEIAEQTYQDMDDVFLDALHTDERRLQQEETVAWEADNVAKAEELQMRHTLSRLTKYFAYKATPAHGQETMFNTQQLMDLDRGIEAMNDYAWIQGLEHAEDGERARRFLSTHTGTRDALPVTRLEERYSEDDLLFRYVTDIPTYTELRDTMSDLPPTTLENDVKWGRRRWLGEKLSGILCLSYLAGDEVRDGVMTASTTMGQYVLDTTAHPGVADAAASSTEFAGLLIGGTALVLGGNLAGTTAARGIKTAVETGRNTE